VEINRGPSLVPVLSPALYGIRLARLVIHTISLSEDKPCAGLSLERNTHMAKNISFDARLIAFVKATKSSMAAALDCSKLAILHFEQHGDLSYAQRFLEAMPKNYVRRVAFVKWLAAHAPVLVEQAKLVKDKGENAVPFNTKAALAMPFWEYAPDQEDIIVTSEDAFKKFQAAVKFFRRDNVKMKDEAGKKLVDAVDSLIKNMARANKAAA
jgi:hypothetical protein